MCRAVKEQVLRGNVLVFKEQKCSKGWEREEGVLPTPRTANAPLNKEKLDKTCD